LELGITDTLIICFSCHLIKQSQSSEFSQHCTTFSHMTFITFGGCQEAKTSHITLKMCPFKVLLLIMFMGACWDSLQCFLRLTAVFDFCGWCKTLLFSASRH